MNKIEHFFSTIPEHSRQKRGELISYFVFFLTMDGGYAKTEEIEKCFIDLDIPPYTNIPSFISAKNSEAIPSFIKSKDGYRLSRTERERVKRNLNLEPEPEYTNELIPISIFDGSPAYMKKIAEEMCSCFHYGLYNSCAVMMRKLFESLIIELYESKKREDIIRNGSDFLPFAELINKVKTTNLWNPSRNFKNGIDCVKALGDVCAHNRKFNAKKSDITDIKEKIRQSLEELVQETYNKV